jgi:hypothetical protein
MAEMKPGLEAVSATVEPKEELGVQTGTKAKPVVASESVLEQMKQLRDKKQAANNYWLEDLKDAYAWWGGVNPNADLALRAQVRANQQKELSDLNTGIAGQQNAIQNRNSFFGTQPTAQPSVQTVAPITAKAPNAVGGAGQSNINIPQAKAGAQELNQVTGGVLGLIKDPALQTAIGFQYLTDPQKATGEVMNFLAKQAEDSQDVKNLRFLIASGAIKPTAVNQAILVKILGPGAFNTTDVQDSMGFTKKAFPLDIAGSYINKQAPIQSRAPVVGGGVPPAVSGGVPPALGGGAPPPPPVLGGGAPPVMGGNAPAVGGGAPPMPPPVQARPTMPAPTMAPPVQAPPVMPTRPTVPVAAPVAAPITPVTPVAGNVVNPAQQEALGGLVPPGTLQAAEVLKEAAKAQNEPFQKGRQKGFETSFKTAEEEGDQIKANWRNAGNQINIADTMKELAKRNEATLGVFQKAGPGVAAANALDEGLHLGNNGQFGLPLQEVAARLVPGSSNQALRDRERLKSLLGDQQLLIAQMNKGQGTWSDLERKIISGIVGSVANSAEFLIRRAELLKTRAEFDKDMGDKYRVFMQNPKNLARDFINSDAYESAVVNYSGKLRDKFDKEFVAGKGYSAEFGDRTKEVLNKYPERKGARP